MSTTARKSGGKVLVVISTNDMWVPEHTFMAEESSVLSQALEQVVWLRCNRTRVYSVSVPAADVRVSL